MKKSFIKLTASMLLIVSVLMTGCAKYKNSTDNDNQSKSNSTQSAADSDKTTDSTDNTTSDKTALNGDDAVKLDLKGKKPIVTIEMQDGGIIKAELYPDIAPKTVSNFVYLIQHKFYDGLKFHRICAGFMIQGGDPNGDGTGGPGYTIPGEFSSNGFNNTLKHTHGVLSMARTNEPNSAGSQFFIMLGDTPSLDGQYATFGKVIEGLDVVDKIGSTKTSVNPDTNEQSVPEVEQVMKKVTVEIK